MTSAAGAAAPQPGHTLTWGAQKADHHVAALITSGVTGLVAAGAATFVTTPDFLSSAMGLGKRLGVIGGAAAVAGLAAAGVVAFIHHATNSQPDLPDGSTTPSFPSPATLAGLPGAQAAEGAVAHVKGEYSEQVSQQVYTGNDSNGNPQYTTQFHTEWYDFAVDPKAHQQVGRFDGYDTAAEALKDAAGHGTVAVEQIGARYDLFRIDSGHLNDEIEHVTSTNTAVRAIATAGGDTYVRSGSNGELAKGARLAGVDSAKHAQGAKVARFAVRNHGDADAAIGSLTSPTAGYASFAEALGDMHARAGDQAVLARNGRFVTADLSVPDVSRDNELLGLRSEGDSSVQAIEVGGTIYGRDGDWWVVPQAAK